MVSLPNVHKANDSFIFKQNVIYVFTEVCMNSEEQYVMEFIKENCRMNSNYYYFLSRDYAILWSHRTTHP